jgi:N-methylhydantoinase B
MRWDALNVGSEGGMATGSSDGDQTHPPAAAGGLPSPLCTAYLQRDGERIPVKPHRMYQIRPGDLLVKISGGGSGVGDPREREPERVLNDVVDGFISLEAAEKLYGVAIDAAKMAIDWERTRALRKETSKESDK